MLFDERLARAQRTAVQPDGLRVATQAEARQLRKALRRARRRSGSVEQPATVVQPAAVSAEPAGTPAPAPVEA